MITCSPWDTINDSLGDKMTNRHLTHVLVTLITLAATVFTACGTSTKQEAGASKMTRETPSATETSTATEGSCVSFIDVGKGDCILIEADGKAALIDTGYKETSSKVLDYLHKRGVEQLEFIILTHYDRDHVGGLGAIAQALPTGEVCLPNYEGGDKNYDDVVSTVQRLKLNARQATEGTAYDLGEAHLSVTPTSLTYKIDKGEDEGNDNDLSLVVALAYRNDSYLFAGDLEKEGIDAYLNASQGSFDVLKMPHHGKKNGRTDELIEDATPKVAVITDSKDDPADKKVLDLLKDAGVDSYRTSSNGTIVINGDGTSGYAITTER